MSFTYQKLEEPTHFDSVEGAQESQDEKEAIKKELFLRLHKRLVENRKAGSVYFIHVNDFYPLTKNEIIEYLNQLGVNMDCESMAEKVANVIFDKFVKIKI